ncbi:MAG: SpoIIE family protein phosphatase [Crocinitomix sp.]|nr:SpoIIE family protein phosphatase [Crocinitomix sp.]
MNKFFRAYPLIVLACYFISFNSFGQDQTYIDSLKQITETTDNDSIKIDALMKWDRLIMYTDEELDFELMHKISNICKKNMEKGVVECEPYFYRTLSYTCNQLGWIYGQRGDIQSSLSYHTESLQLSEELKEYGGMSRAHNDLGMLHGRLKNYEFATFHFNEGIKYARLSGEEHLEMSHQFNLVSLYSDLSDNKEGNEKETYKDTVLTKYSNLLFQLDNLLESDSLAINLRHRFNYYKSATLVNVASIYASRQQNTLALNYSTEALEISKKNDDIENISYALLQISECHLDMGNIDQSIAIAHESLEYSERSSMADLISKASHVLSEAYKEKKNYNQALVYFEQYVTFKDSVFNKENQRALIQQQYKFEFEKKSIEDSLIHANEQYLKDEEIGKQELTIKNERAQKSKLYIFIAFLAFIAVAIYLGFRQKKKANKLIHSQKREVEEHQKKMIDSITYAQKIQKSLLPNIADIQTHFPSFKNLNLPKDIVSGDFYWFHHEAGISYLVLSDCTGHGVPGAFMSMIGVSLLNEIIVTKKETKLDRILTLLDDRIQVLLGQHDQDASEDGMELGIIKLDHRSNKMDFAGARQNLYLVREEGTEIIKGNIRPIGGWVRKRSRLADFTSQSISLDALKAIYLATDGLEDQLGGQHYKKFGRKQFVQLISEMETNPDMEILRKKLTNWRGNVEQLDDISVIGIRMESRATSVHYNTCL